VLRAVAERRPTTGQGNDAAELERESARAFAAFFIGAKEENERRIDRGSDRERNGRNCTNAREGIFR